MLHAESREKHNRVHARVDPLTILLAVVILVAIYAFVVCASRSTSISRPDDPFWWLTPNSRGATSGDEMMFSERDYVDAVAGMDEGMDAILADIGNSLSKGNDAARLHDDLDLKKCIVESYLAALEGLEAPQGMVGYHQAVRVRYQCIDEWIGTMMLSLDQNGTLQAKEVDECRERLDAADAALKNLKTTILVN